MKERRIRWQTAGAKTVIFCVQTGRHFVVLEEDRQTGEVTRIAETFGALEGWRAYNATVDQRIGAALDATNPRPEREEDMFRLRKGEPYITNLKHPVIAALMEDYRVGNNIPHGDQLSDRKRREFDRLAVEYLHPGVPQQIIDSMLRGE